jgi:hypothetical protein
MSYLDKAKSVSSQTPDKPVESKPYELNELTNKASQTAQTVLNPVRNNSPDTLPRLSWQLERLISAACADVLPETVMLSSGLVTDLGRYVRAWGCSYLVSDRVEAERRLWEAHRTWKEPN